MYSIMIKSYCKYNGDNILVTMTIIIKNYDNNINHNSYYDKCGDNNNYNKYQKYWWKKHRN